MKWTKERKLYVAVLGIGLLALVGDRLLFTPAGADAAALTESYAPTKSSAPSVPTLPELSLGPGGRGLAYRLRTDVPNWDQTIANAFKASEAWLPPPKIQDPSAPPQSGGEAFCNSHVLKGVTGPRSTIPGAWVSNRFLRIGEILDGWVLIAVELDSATFEKDGEQAVLRMEMKKVPGFSRREPEPFGPPEEDK